MALAHAILIPCRCTTFGRLKPLSLKPIAYSNCIDLGGTNQKGGSQTQPRFPSIVHLHTAALWLITRPDFDLSQRRGLCCQGTEVRWRC